MHLTQDKFNSAQLTKFPKPLLIPFVSFSEQIKLKGNFVQKNFREFFGIEPPFIRIIPSSGTNFQHHCHYD
jgi:hypothetical protein